MGWVDGRRTCHSVLSPAAAAVAHLIAVPVAGGCDEVEAEAIAAVNVAVVVILPEAVESPERGHRPSTSATVRRVVVSHQPPPVAVVVAAQSGHGEPDRSMVLARQRRDGLWERHSSVLMPPLYCCRHV